DIEVFLFHSLFLPRAARKDGACLKAGDGRERPSLILVMARSALPCLKFSQELSQAVDGFGRALLHSGGEHPVALLAGLEQHVIGHLRLTALGFFERHRLHGFVARGAFVDRKSTRLNSSHVSISYAV